MLLNNETRNIQAEKRIQLQSCLSILTNAIESGTNCSNFEAEAITGVTQEILGLGEYSEERHLQPGQMIWQAIAADEPPGKPLDKCVYKRIVLTVHKLEEDRETKWDHGMSAKRGQQIVRMTREALDQGALLTAEGLGTILDCNEKTIRKDIKRFERKHDVTIPTRGNKCDIGPGVTHSEKTVEMFIKGKEPVDIARDLQHSLKAVERYINTFCRVVHCQSMARDSLQTALIVGVSSSLVSKYLDLRDRFLKTHAYRDRLKRIEEIGSRYWETVDSKKKAGLLKRRMK
jgi:hypothetical protein